MTLRAIMVNREIAAFLGSGAAVKIVTLHHNFDWRKCEKKKERKEENGSFKVQVENKSLNFVRATTERSVPHPTSSFY